MAVTIFGTLFIFLVVLTIVALFSLRIYKNGRELKKQAYQEKIDSFLNNYLFNDTFDKSVELQRFRSSHLTNSLQKKMTIREILLYNDNLKGETSAIIKKLFKDLELDLFTLRSLKKGRWYEKARAIYVLSELDVKESKTVAQYLNAHQEIVRAQTIYFFIKTADNDPLAFLKKLKAELTLWEMIQVEDCLKSVYDGPTPDFSVWLNHKLDTVVMFSIRMIQQFNQYEHMAKIVPFLRHPNENIRAVAVKSLRKLNYKDLLDEVILNFPTEHRIVKKEIIQAVEALGNIQELLVLKTMGQTVWEWQTELMFQRAEKRVQLKT